MENGGAEDPVSTPRAAPTRGPRAASGAADQLAAAIGRGAGESTVVGVTSLGREHVPTGRDRSVGVPVFVCPSGRIYVAEAHSHAALARQALSAVGLPFDPDHPDRTLGQDHGWAMVQAAGDDGL